MRPCLVACLVGACTNAPTGDEVASSSSSSVSVGGETTSGHTATSGAQTSDDGASTTRGDSETGSGADSGGSESGAVDPVEDAIERGIAGALSLADGDLVLLLLLDVAHRRFAIEPFADAGAQYDAIVAMQVDPPIDAYAFRRIFDPAQTLSADDLAAIAPGPNEVTVPALFCDQLALAPDYGDLLGERAALGGYELTHVVLALEWIGELGCASPVDAAFVDQIVLDTLAPIDASDGLDDLEIEAAFFAALLAGTPVVPPDVLDATLDAQLADGAWPHDPGDSAGDSHTTGLALLLLLELTRAPQDGFVAGS